MNARIAVGGRELHIDVSRPVMLALALDFAGPQPRHFGAPRARSQPFEAAGFEGSVERGASCNCELITLIPHCNGTHTECVGHLTRERLDAWRVVPAGFLPALLLSVTAEAAGAAAGAGRWCQGQCRAGRWPQPAANSTSAAAPARPALAPPDPDRIARSSLQPCCA